MSALKPTNRWPIPARLRPWLGRRRVLLSCGVLFAALYITYRLLAASDTRGNDDAGILWVYAKNLAGGHGLVYKAGEYVEGFSSLLYVVLLACGLGLVKVAGGMAGVQFNPIAVYWISLALNFAAWMLVILVVYRIAREELSSKAAATIALLLASCPAIGYWVVSGMDAPVALFSQVLIWRGVQRVDRCMATADERGALTELSAAIVFSVLARAEGFLWPLLALAWLLWRQPRVAIRPGMALAVAVAGLVLWRLWYYGYPLPNTYYAKVTGALTERLDSAWGLQTRRILFDSGMLVAILGIAAGIANGIATAGRRRQKFVPGVRDFEILAAIAWIGYFFYVGGDVYYERPLLVLVPLGLVSAARALYPVTMTIGGAVLILSTAFILVAYPLWGYYLPLTATHQGDGLRRLGLFLGETYPKSTVALNLAGKIAYYSDLPCIDMLGLCDAHIAHSQPTGPFKVGHSKQGFAYAMKRKPELVAVCPQVFKGDIWGLLIDDGYTIDDMKSIGYLPVLACNVADWRLVRKIGDKPLSTFSADEIRDLVAERSLDLLVFYNPHPSGDLPKRADENRKAIDYEPSAISTQARPTR